MLKEGYLQMNLAVALNVVQLETKATAIAVKSVNFSRLFTPLQWVAQLYFR
jgi:hypothetical protein